MRHAGNAKLTEAQVLVIRERYAQGHSQRELCAIYGVSLNTIGRVIRGETWGWLTERVADPSAGPDPQAQASLQRFLEQHGELVQGAGLAKLQEEAQASPELRARGLLEEMKEEIAQPGNEPRAARSD